MREPTLLEESTTLLVVDDHPIFLDGVSMILQDIYPAATVLKASNGAQALAHVEQHREIDWIFLDFNLPDLNAVELMAKFKQHNLFASIVIVSSEDQPDMVDAVLRAGANGFLSKISEKAEFLKCIEHIEKGQQYIQNAMQDALLNYRNTILPERLHSQQNLSSRQQEVLTLLANGLSNFEIGQTLLITENTVKSHVASLMAKLEADSRTHCVAEARRLGILA